MDEIDIAILRIIDGLWETYEYVPIDEIMKRIGYSRQVVKKKIRELEKNGYIAYRKRATFDKPSVKNLEKAQDALAIWDFKRHGVFDILGSVVGSGKEADVYLAYKGDKKYIVKFHRYYGAEFRKIKESFSFTAITYWRIIKKRLLRPVDISRAKAQIEFLTLKKLYGKVNVPEPITINRHAIVMQFIGDDLPAPLLKDVQVDAEIKDQVFENYNKAIELGIVHGDMSEYNVLVHDKVYLIDWPQAVPIEYKLAKTLKERDLERLRNFFQKVLK